VYYLKTNDYEENCFYFWSSIADFQYHIDLQDTLNYFKELFRLAIEEHRREEEGKHKSALQLIDDLIELNQSQQKFLILFNRLKEEILQSLGQYENISCSKSMRRKINEIISSNFDLVEKLEKLIATDCLNIDLEFDNPDDQGQFYEYLKDENQSELFYATNIFIDHSLDHDCWHGINLIFASDTVYFVRDVSEKEITLDVSGRRGEDGRHAQHRQHATRTSEDDLDGLPGGNGEAGQNSGHIYPIAKSRFDGKSNIDKLITSGCEGGAGGTGGNAGNGTSGNFGANAAEGTIFPVLTRYYLARGERGTRGGHGGVGGDAGLAGLGGHAGLIYIEENQTNITDTFISLIESIAKQNIHDQDGQPGEGGKGGTGGRDGYDYLLYRTRVFGRPKTVRGSIYWRGHKNIFWYAEFYFTCDRPSRKPDGINNGAGKSADIQLHSGRIRNKCENKNQSNEEQMKNESNEIINRHNEVSKNISKAMNLFKDQMSDILDERQLKMKTQQLSDSMLNHAYQVVQQALALNIVKTESTILKTSEMNSDDKHDQVSVLNKIKFDQSEQEMIKFKKLNIIADLQYKYQRKIEDFHIQLTENINRKTNQIKSLKSTGRNLFFQTDIVNISSTLFSLKQNPIPQQHKPFQLNEYFQQLNELKRQKQKFIKIKNQFNQFNIKEFIHNLCLEFGNEEIIKKKLMIFDEIFHLNIVDINDLIERIYSPDDSQPELNFPNELRTISSQNKTKFQQFEFNQYSPIYHQSNEEQIIEIHPIEELINEFLHSKEKNLELIIRIFHSLSSIINSNQENLFCKKKFEKFLYFLFINLIFIRTDFNHGHLFHSMKRILNSIQLNYSTSLFNRLQPVLVLKEKQFHEFQKCLEKI
ncbi:unnamed protein product, partial [Didymodactylos carnosus]